MFKKHEIYTLFSEEFLIYSHLEEGEGIFFDLIKPVNIFYLISDQAFYIIEDNVLNVKRRIPWNNFKAIYLKELNENDLEIWISGYNTKYLENFMIKDEENLKSFFQLNFNRNNIDNIKEMIEIMEKVHYYKFLTKLKIFKVNKHFNENESNSISNVSHYNHYLNFSKTFLNDFEKNENLIAIYKVKKFTQKGSFCNRFLVLSNKFIYNFSNNTVCKLKIPFELITEIGITNNFDNIVFIAGHENFSFITRSCCEICIIIKFIIEKNLKKKFDIKLIELKDNSNQNHKKGSIIYENFKSNLKPNGKNF